MHFHSFGTRIFAFLLILLLVSICGISFATAEKVYIPIPRPLLGDLGQAGLWFDGLPWNVEPDISAIWCNEMGDLFFIIRGDISALYRWKYNQGEISLLNAKDREEENDSFLLEGAKEQQIIDFFSQDQQLYGIDGKNGHLLTMDTNGWHVSNLIDWSRIAQSVGLDQINFENVSTKPYQFVKMESFLYCLIPKGSASSLVSINLKTGVCNVINIPDVDRIQAYREDDLFVQVGSELKQYHASTRTLTHTFSNCDIFVYDSVQSTLYYKYGSLLYESKDLHTSRAICSPIMSNIRTLVALPEYQLAVYGDTGISIVNTQLNPGKKLRIQDYYTLSNESELFSLANPDVSIEMVNTSLDEVDFITNDNNLDIITQAFAADIPYYCRKDYLAPLSVSAKLRVIAKTYYPQIREVISYNDTLFAMPLALGVSCYQADSSIFEAADSLRFPQDLDTFFQQVEQFATKDVYDGSQTYLENILYDLTEQYSVQYASASAPVRFDMPVYRTILSRMKEIAKKGITGSCLYFSANNSYGQSYGLDELGSNGMIPFAFPCFEHKQTPKLIASLEIYLINKLSRNQKEAIRFLEFISIYPNHKLKYSLLPQSHQRPFDIADEQKQVVDFSLSRLRRGSMDMDNSERLERIDALIKKSQMLESQEREITDVGLSFYRANASNMSFQTIGCYDFVVADDRQPYFTSFLYGSMSADDLIMMLNARAYDNYALIH